MYNAFWRHALFVRGQSFSVKIFDRSRSGCQVIRLGVRDASTPLACLPPARRSFLRPLLPSSCYKKLCERNLRNLSLSFVLYLGEILNCNLLRGNY